MGTSEKKEVLWAVIIGFAIGLVITFGVITANRAIKQKTEQTPSPTSVSSPTPEAEAEKEIFLEIVKPEDESLQSEDEITLEGNTVTRATVVVFYEGGEQIIEADDTGKFTTKIKLIGGANQITVKSFTEDGNQAEKKLSVVLTSAKI
jgi:hypothetical protein